MTPPEIKRICIYSRIIGNWGREDEEILKYRLTNMKSNGYTAAGQ